MDELDMDLADLLRAAGGMSRQNLLDIRKGRTTPRPKTRRKIEDALRLEAGGYEQMERGEKPTSLPEPPSLRQVAEADFEAVMTMSRADLAKLADLIEQVSGAVAAEKFLRDASDLRRRRSEERGIEPSARDERDVS
ncbi:hypothetical protein [Kibdelosporangium phytohabitans]|nr:hypothetical protein [Kibdelosporangium phytohabitans]MBE1468053.1 transcriptional regulator with XRE-family HTH domain [Kibdelosporangium phytohabitans]